MHALETTVAMNLADTEHAIRAALATQGFGVLTEIDVSALLEQRLGVERPPLKILGACNPTLANQALDIDPSVALLLPCNVVLDEADGGGTRVRIVDPLALIDDPRFAALADDATNRLQAALDVLGVRAAS